MFCVIYLLVFLLFHFNFVEQYALGNNDLSSDKFNMQIPEQGSPDNIPVIFKIKSRKLLEISTESATAPPAEGELSIGEKIKQFYEDDNNMALYCVLPLLILVYGGCSVIYCVHRCRKNFRKRNRVGDSKEFLIKSDGKGKPTPKPEIVHPKIKVDPNEQVKDLLTDYEFFTSWVIAQKTADLLELQGGRNNPIPPSINSLEANNVSQNYGSAVGGKKKKLVFVT